MSADILPFKKPEKKKRTGTYDGALELQRAAREQDKENPKPKSTLASRVKTNNDIFLEVRGDVLAIWQNHAVHNRLNEYVYDTFIQTEKNLNINSLSDLLTDLNVLSRIECSLGMKIAIFYPGCVKQSSYGWMVSFHRGSEIFSTPADMSDEAMARALAIVLFIEFEKTLKSYGRSLISNDN